MCNVAERQIRVFSGEVRVRSSRAEQVLVSESRQRGPRGGPHVEGVRGPCGSRRLDLVRAAQSHAKAGRRVICVDIGMQEFLATWHPSSEQAKAIETSDPGRGERLAPLAHATSR